ncbi:MAG TPA: LacI family DNA-binding transcriptional regulator, partial [Prolixibacteraceae bacterium]|nr:LacI family DNA-binding transcriptional regulator [Prolixibacteraceae bacterium]
MKREATIYDIAKELNISASTVSRALKGNTIINLHTRQKVQECAEKLGY